MQLDALEEVLVQGRAAAESELEAVPDIAAPGDVYAACRKAEERVTFLRRYWLYFRTKWDQRDDCVVGPVVRSADEAIGSCWAPVFSAAGRRSAGAGASALPRAVLGSARHHAHRPA